MLAFDTLFSCQGAQHPARTNVLSGLPLYSRRTAREGSATSAADAGRHCGRARTTKQVIRRRVDSALRPHQSEESPLPDLNHRARESAGIKGLVAHLFAIDAHGTLTYQAAGLRA